MRARGLEERAFGAQDTAITFGPAFGAARNVIFDLAKSPPGRQFEWDRFIDLLPFRYASMTHRFRLKRPYIFLFASLWAFSFGLPADGYSHAAGPGRVWADWLQGAADTAPQIDHLTPVQAGAGSEVTVEIDGKNFARGAYVSSSNPEVHVLRTKRINDNRLETRVVIAQKAQPGVVAFYVTSPDGSVAQATFTIIGPASPEGSAVQVSSVPQAGPQGRAANGTAAATEEVSAPPRGSPE